ncbi:MAG: flagellar type III secretion system pore protein FliP [Sphingomonadales bacterium]|nr:flagellar type III secretion system pore protein FliP [Sphingomonadales bacterium]
MRSRFFLFTSILFLTSFWVLSVPAFAAASAGEIRLPQESESLVRTALLLGLMAFLPALVISMTSFVRIVIVLSMIRHALGMPETPPNTVLVSLALFMTALSMGPTLQQSASTGLQPFLDGSKSIAAAMEDGGAPLKQFMLKQVRDTDLKTIYEIAKKPLPKTEADVELMQLVPAFMLNELRTAFTIGFVILLPFLLIDLVVSAILLSLGMLMVPPATISLPLKILMFVLIDGWGLILEGVMGSFR